MSYIMEKSLTSDAQLGYKYRGLIIDEFINLELSLTKYLTKYFLGATNERDYAFQVIILDRLTFEHKRASFKSVIDAISKHRGFKKTKSTPSKYKSLLEDIRRLNDFRNQFAHYFIVGVFLIDKKKTVVLTELRDGIKPISYTEDDIENKLDLIKQIVNTIEDMIKEIPSEYISIRRD